ncbi:MAG: hypothetical protein HY308_09320 [Gammaproteobacteria bacterium]|nr:hypothetical protein [Gammaproteobacteria bacterium]
MDKIMVVLCKHKGKLLIIGLAVCAAVFLYPRSRLESVVASPDGSYRLEYYDVSLLQWLMNRDKADPGFVRLYRNSGNQYMGESEVVDFFLGADPMWLMAQTGEVSVGRDIVFKGVPPVNAVGEVMKVPNPTAPAAE